MGTKKTRTQLTRRETTRSITEPRRFSDPAYTESSGRAGGRGMAKTSLLSGDKSVPVFFLLSAGGYYPLPLDTEIEVLSSGPFTLNRATESNSISGG